MNRISVTLTFKINDQLYSKTSDFTASDLLEGSDLNKMVQAVGRDLIELAIQNPDVFTKSDLVAQDAVDVE